MYALVFIALLLVGVFFGLRDKDRAVLHLSVSDYKAASMCLRVIEGNADVWPHVAVILAAEQVRLGGSGSVLFAVEPQTDKQVLESGLRADVANLDQLEVASSSSLAIGTALLTGDATLISLVPPVDAVKEGVASVSVTRIQPLDEQPVDCPPHGDSVDDNSVGSRFDVSVAAFGGSGVQASLSAVGEDAERLVAGVGQEIQISGIASILGGGAYVPGLLPIDFGHGGGLFTLPAQLVDSDGGRPVFFAARGDANAEVNVAGAGIVNWRVKGFTRAELVVDDRDPIIVGEEDVLEFTTTAREAHSRWLSMEAAGDVVVSTPISAISINGESRMPARTPILDNWLPQVFWWAAFALVGYLVGSLRRATVGGTMNDPDSHHGAEGTQLHDGAHKGRTA